MTIGEPDGGGGIDVTPAQVAGKGHVDAGMEVLFTNLSLDILLERKILLKPITCRPVAAVESSRTAGEPSIIDTRQRSSALILRFR